MLTGCVRRISREGIVIQVSSSDLAELPGAVRRAADTLSLGIVVAALIVAAAVVIVAKDDQAAAVARIAIVILSGVGLAAFVSRLFWRD